MKQAAVGFRAHSGWTSLVAISLEENSPRVLLRQRPHLVKKFSFEFRQPYHSAENLSPSEGRSFISFVRKEARGLAYQAIRSVQTGLREDGFELKHCALLLASGRPLPALPQILASHALIHTADGELFREALLHGGRRCGLDSFTAREGELLERASRTLHIQPEDLVRRLVNLGAELGPPWTQDEKHSALAAWLSLVERIKPS
jgi:hypothetical protein